WEKLAQAGEVRAVNIKKMTMLEGSRGHTGGFNTTLFEIARTLLRAAEERQKPNGERLREYRDSSKQSLELELFSDEPLYDDYEEVKLADSLTWLAEQFGYTDPLVQQVLDHKSPQARAHELVAGTRLKAIAERKKLYEEG